MSNEKLLYRLEQPHGPGEVYITWQLGSGSYIAITGCDSTVSIFDRYGQSKGRIKLPALCSGFAWDSDGDVLAVIASNSPQLLIWDANNTRQQTIDVGLRDPMSCLFWGKSCPILAVGTNRGNLAIYHHNTAKRIPIIGKHNKRITCGSWNTENLLALGSEDRTLSISNADGDTLRIISLRADPADIQFAEMKTDERIGGENTVSLIVGKRTLYLYNLIDPENPIELAFQQHYGSIVTYKWYGDGYIMIGFSAGFFIAISTHIKEVGQELFQIRNHKSSLNDIAFSTRLGKVATCGDNIVKIHDISNLQETSSVIVLEHETEVERVGWSEDGQLLAVCGRSGNISFYLTRLSSLTAVCGAKIALLAGLVDIAIYQFSPDITKQIPVILSTEVEPSFIALGPFHLACGMNNRAWLYDLTRPQISGDISTPYLVRDREYLSAITSMHLNTEYASVLFDGKLQLHLIEQTDVDHDHKDSKMFPDLNKQETIITDHALTTDFLIYSTDMGHIVYFFTEDWKLSLEFQHSVGIKNIFVDPAGTRLVFIDDKSHGYVYNPVNGDVVNIPEFSPTIIGVLWDNNLTDRNIFVAFDEQEITTYIYVRQSIKGTSVKKIGLMKLGSQQIPLLLFSGEITLGTASGQLTQLMLITHEMYTGFGNDRSNINEEDILHKQLQLQKYQEAWDTCMKLQTKDLWLQLAKTAMENLEIDWAIRVYSQIEDVGMVWALYELEDVDDWREMCGHVALLLGDIENAQKWLITAGKPLYVLDMQRDLMHWDEALRLAKQHAPEQISTIAREYAQQLEFTGNYNEALGHYERGLQDSEFLMDDHKILCLYGIARTSIRVGNYRKGVQLALESNNAQLQKECADLLEAKKQFNDCALMYEKCRQFDKAASVYIKLKNWKKVGEFIDNITSPKIHLQYAKAKESDGMYEDAVNAYHIAKDYDSVIRLQLEKLNNPEAAVELVQTTKSIEGAKMVARFFQRLDDYSSAIRFLVISQCFEEAFQMARKHNKLDLYGEILIKTLAIDEGRESDFRSLAVHFEAEKNFLFAGKYYFHAREFEKAMKLLLRVAKTSSDDNEALSLAIDVVASSNDETLASQLIEFLLGETNGGIPKDPKYLFRLYMARKQYREAAKTAIIIANEEQINGNYRNAHDILFSMYQELKQNKIKIPTEMQANLTLLHSYILVRIHVRRGDHLRGARMLIRVANNISKFPSHIVPILTSTVIECHRSNLKKQAFNFAAMLMRPEYRSQVDQKYSKKIEAVVRKPPKGDLSNEQEPSSPCPYCDFKVQETELMCNQCKNTLPFCIATGRHIIKEDLTACPVCDFPAIKSEFTKLLETEDSCPMCSEKIDIRRIIKVTNSRPYLYLNDDYED